MERHQQIRKEQSSLRDKFEQKEIKVEDFVSQMILLNEELKIVEQKMYDEHDKIKKSEYIKIIEQIFEKWIPHVNYANLKYAPILYIRDFRNNIKYLKGDKLKKVFNDILVEYKRQHWIIPTFEDFCLKLDYRHHHIEWDEIKFDKDIELDNPVGWNIFLKYIISNTNIPLKYICIKDEDQAFINHDFMDYADYSNEERIKRGSYLKYLYNLSETYIKLIK